MTLKHADSVIPTSQIAIFHVMTNWKSFGAPLKGITFKQFHENQSNGSGVSMGDNIQTIYRQYTDTQTAPYLLTYSMVQSSS